VQDELNIRGKELRTAEQTMNRLVEEKISLEQNIRRIERKHAEEVMPKFWSLLLVAQNCSHMKLTLMLQAG